MSESAEKLPQWEQAWLRSANDPLLFVTDVLGASPEPWQAQALKLIGEHDRVSIRAGHGVGKTTFLAWVVLWFMLTRMPFKIPITANSQDQLRDVVWPELRKWHGRLPEPLRAEIEVAAERLFLRGAPECFAVARTASKDNPEALQGFHEDNLLFVVEEASGIDDIVFEVGAGALSTAGAKLLMLANPTRTSGYFYDSHHILRHRFKTMRVNSEDVPRARGHIDDIIAKHGKDSNVYRVRVLGEFPDTEDDAIIPLHLCEAAMVRKVAKTPYRPVWGLDVATFGDDRLALAKRAGNTLLEPVKWWRNRDTMQAVGLVVNEWHKTDEIDRPSIIAVDEIGIGAGVCHRLQELDLPAVGINVGEKPDDPERFMRLRDQMWWHGREWLERTDVVLCDDQELIAELTAMKYKMMSDAKIKVESNDDLEKRGLKSPDLATAFLLTLVRKWDERRPDDQIDRYRKRLYGNRSGSAWAA